MGRFPRVTHSCATLGQLIFLKEKLIGVGVGAGVSGASSLFISKFQTCSPTPTLLHLHPINFEKINWPSVRLACLRPAASVRSEPGSNSHVFENLMFKSCALETKLLT